MSIIRLSKSINAPVDKVFEFVTDPSNWTRYVTSLVDVRDLSPDCPKKNSTFKWEYKMFGMKFKGNGVVIENIKNKSFGLSLEGKMPIKEHYDFVDKGDSTTELTVSIEYEMPPVMEEFVPKKLIERVNNLEAKNVLDKIKMLCEGG